MELGITEINSVWYAILFSGMSFRRHVNDLEFCYRTLVDRLRFSIENIHVLNYDGSLRAFGDAENDPIGAWPGDGTLHRMIVNAEGSRAAFRHALETIGKKLRADDQLFINTMGHGGHHGEGWGPDLLTYPACARYNCTDFCADLARLPVHRSMVVLMSQCFSGGFNRAIVAASPATSTFIASATSETRPSFASLEDLQWNPFQRNWIAALGQCDVDGRPISAFPGEAVRDHPVTIRDAFAYAVNCPARSPYDSPESAERPQTAGDLTLC